MIEIVYQDSKELCRKLFYRIYGIRCAVYAVGMAVFALFSLNQFLTYGDALNLMLTVACTVGIPWFLAYPAITAGRTFQARLKDCRGELPRATAKFGEQLHISDKVYGSQLDYGDIKKIYYDDGFLALYTFGRQVYMIPTEGFTQGSLPELKAFLAEKCTLAQIREKKAKG